MPFSQKFVITPSDIVKREIKGPRDHLRDRLMTEAKELLDGFDPEDDSQDRRMLYEVTGLRLD